MSTETIVRDLTAAATIRIVDAINDAQTLAHLAGANIETRSTMTDAMHSSALACAVATAIVAGRERDPTAAAIHYLERRIEFIREHGIRIPAAMFDALRAKG